MTSTTKNRNRLTTLLAACGTAAAITSGANAQPYLINISGATLLENFVIGPGSTNDFIDVDGDGVAGSVGPGFTVEQLAPVIPQSPYPASLYWIVNYRVTGSVRGLAELIRLGSPNYSTTPDVLSPTLPGPLELANYQASKAYCNRNQYNNNGAPFGTLYNAQNPGGQPCRSDVVGTHLASPYTNPGFASVGGVQIDIAPLDVPSLWGVTQPGGSPSPLLTPGDPGYGLNPQLNLNKDGTSTAFGHQMVDIGSRNLNTASPDFNTIFDSPLAYVPVAVITNLGTGYQQMTAAQLRHLYATGRLPSGENLVAVTRDSESGTHNAFANSICLDPSWCVGENIGNLSNASAEQQLGLSFIPGNKGGSGPLEGTVQNHRLAIGYSGAERGVTGSGTGTWLTGGKNEIIAVRNDGAATFRRPTIANVLNNSTPESYRIAGPAILATIGDPRSAPVAKGGDAGNTNPDMENVEAAAYVNNVTRSVAAFIALPGGGPTVFSPGELLATLYALEPATDSIKDVSNPCSFIPNPIFNLNLKNFTLANSVLANAAYATFGTATLNGKVPTRPNAAATYSDQALVPAGDRYINQGGVTVNYGSNLTSRNRIAGDFDGNGLRNVNDAANLIAAYKQRNGGPAWVAPAGSGPIAGAPGTDAIIEVLGDFNGDGSFNSKDVRYWADGLAVQVAGPNTGNVDRYEGFKAVDVANGSPFFVTAIATGKAYANGDAAGDVAGPSGLQTPNFAPIGADGAINAYDIDYVLKQFRQNPSVVGDSLDWSVYGEAIGGDFSADINGDRSINCSDLYFLLNTVLGTRIGDVNLDGAVTVADRAIAQGSFGPGGWAQGDVTGNGIVDAADVAVINMYLCPGDANKAGDGVNFADVTVTLVNFGGNYQATCEGTGLGDANNDGLVNFADVTAVLVNFGAACP